MFEIFRQKKQNGDDGKLKLIRNLTHKIFAQIQNAQNIKIRFITIGILKLMNAF